MIEKAKRLNDMNAASTSLDQDERGIHVVSAWPRGGVCGGPGQREARAEGVMAAPGVGMPPAGGVPVPPGLVVAPGAVVVLGVVPAAPAQGSVKPIAPRPA
jgi:hypothetical protein